MYHKRNRLPHQPPHSTQGQTQGGQATRRKDSSPPALLHPLSFLEISERTEHPQHTPSFWGRCSCLRGPHPKLRPPEQASTSLFTVQGSRGWEEAVRNTCFHIQALSFGPWSHVSELPFPFFCQLVTIKVFSDSPPEDGEMGGGPTHPAYPGVFLWLSVDKIQFSACRYSHLLCVSAINHAHLLVPDIFGEPKGKVKPSLLSASSYQHPAHRAPPRPISPSCCPLRETTPALTSNVLLTQPTLPWLLEGDLPPTHHEPLGQPLLHPLAVVPPPQPSPPTHSQACLLYSPSCRQQVAQLQNTPAPHCILVILLLPRVTSTWFLGFVHAGPSARDTCCIEPREIILTL